MGPKRGASSKENQHPTVKKLKADTPKRPSIRRKKDTDVILPVWKHNTGPGVVLTCGQGDVGQLGLGPDVMEKSRFSLVPDVQNVVEIAAGGMHTVCLTEEGKVFTWGCNDEGALGRVVQEGEESIPGSVDLPKKAVQISAGDSHSVALLEDGTVYAWGSFRDSHGSMGLKGQGIQKEPVELSINGKTLRNIVKISSGADHCVMLTSTGTLYSAGCPEQGQLGRLPQRSATRDSRKGMGCLDLGEVPIKRLQIDNIYTGDYNTFVTSKNSQTLAFGLNNYSQLGEEGSQELDNRNTCFFYPQHIKSLSDKSWSMLVTGQHHSLGLDNEGCMYSFGRHDYGRLGLGPDVKEPVATPTPITTFKDKIEAKKIKFVACGSCVSFAIDNDGTLFGWGMGNGYQLGTGNEDDVWEPTKIEGKQINEYTVLQVASGGQHSVILARKK